MPRLVLFVLKVCGLGCVEGDCSPDDREDHRKESERGTVHESVFDHCSPFGLVSEKKTSSRTFATAYDACPRRRTASTATIAKART